jgi:uncharacterized repeat protein (TIGR03803 family)
VPEGGETITTLASFTPPGGDYPEPISGLTLVGSTFYGTTENGGGYGTVFSVPEVGGAITTLASFSGGYIGGYPESGLTLAGSALYGTTYRGGFGLVGTVFSIPVGGGAIANMATFTQTTGSGFYPESGLILVGNTLYGTTYSGRGFGGTVFSMPVGGGAITTLAGFTGDNGLNPEAGLILVGGTLYGTTYNGGDSGDGTVFSVPLGGGAITTLASFSGSNGANPESSLTLFENTLYGTTYD